VTEQAESSSGPVWEPVDLISRIAPDGRILHVSPSSREVLGVPPEALVGRMIWSLVHPVDAAVLPGAPGVPISAVLGERATVRLRHRQGHWVWLEMALARVHDASGGPPEIHVRARDVTQRRGGDAQIDHESKLESLGRLSAGLAHEINSPIQFVGDNARFLASAYNDLTGVLLTYRDLLTSDVPMGSQERLARMKAAEEDVELDYLRTEIPQAVAQTLEGIDRVATIVRAMKTFSHPGHTEQVPADINESLVATATVTRHQVSSVADLVLDLGDIPPVRCYVADLNQVFLNLIVNAADAIADTGAPGVIRVTTELDADDVLISISDTGVGIPDNERARIFEPFFTTKDVGRWSGQGLPLVRAVVHEGHAGTVTVDSTVGAGSIFTVRLPVHGLPEPSYV
jgi:PAS domain S-box-containing protein